MRLIQVEGQSTEVAQAPKNVDTIAEDPEAEAQDDVAEESAGVAYTAAVLLSITDRFLGPSLTSLSGLNAAVSHPFGPTSSIKCQSSVTQHSPRCSVHIYLARAFH